MSRNDHHAAALPRRHRCRGRERGRGALHPEIPGRARPGQAGRADRARLGRRLGREPGCGRVAAVLRGDRRRRAPRPHRGQRDPAQDLGRGRPGPGAADPHQLGHHDQRHQVGAARRDRGSGRPAEPRGPAAARQAGGPGGLAAGQHLLLRLRAGLSRRGFPGRPARQLAGHDRPEVQGPGRDLRRRHRLPSGRPDRGRRHAGGHPRQHGAGLGRSSRS